MPSQRFIVGASMLLALAASAGCGGVTQYQGAQAFAIAGNPPPPPPPPPAPKEEPKPPPRVELRDNKIDFKEKIQFDNNKATIKEASFSLLHDIADVIKKNPQVKKLSIEGHASAEGDAKANKKLSDDRAKSVMDYLVKKESIPAAQLTAKGWGIEKPIADNATEEGREKNRRVEFLVVDQDVTQKKVEVDPTTGKEKVVGEKTESVKTDTGSPSTPAAPTPKAGGTPPAGTTPPKKVTTPAPKGSAAPAAGAAAPKPTEKK